MSESIQEQMLYIRNRLKDLDETHHSSWPDWDNRDYIAIGRLLLEVHYLTNLQRASKIKENIARIMARHKPTAPALGSEIASELFNAIDQILGNKIDET